PACSGTRPADQASSSPSACLHGNFRDGQEHLYAGPEGPDRSTATWYGRAPDPAHNPQTSSPARPVPLQAGPPASPSPPRRPPPRPPGPAVRRQPQHLLRTPSGGPVGHVIRYQRQSGPDEPKRPD